MPLPEEMQSRTYFEFGSIEEHYKYRDAVMKAYPQGNYPVFEGDNHMQFQIRDPEGFAEMLRLVMEESQLKAFVYRNIGRHLMNGNVKRIRNLALES